METGTLKMPCFHKIPDVRNFGRRYHGNRDEILRMNVNSIPSAPYKTCIPKIFKMLKIMWPRFIKLG